MVAAKWAHPMAGSEVGHGFVQVYEHLDAVEAHLRAIEKRINVAPVVIDETAYIPIEAVIEGASLRTMQATSLPTGWTITGQTMNDLPTTGYWEISPKGTVSATAFGVGGVRKHATVEIRVQATNEFGVGDGKLDLRFT